jgi:hypothetical protein
MEPQLIKSDDDGESVFRLLKIAFLKDAKGLKDGILRKISPGKTVNENRLPAFTQKVLRKAQADLFKAWRNGAQMFIRYLDGTFKEKALLPLGMPEWQKQPSIRNRLSRSRLNEVMRYLRRNTLPYKEGLELVSQIRGHGPKEQLLQYMVVVPDYKTMERALLISGQTLRMYIRQFVKNDWLIDLGRIGPRGRKHYAVGCWQVDSKQSAEESSPSKRWFFANTRKTLTQLRGFKLRTDGNKENSA